MIRSACLLLVAANVLALPRLSRSETLEVPSALVKLIEQVDVPARESGVLAEVLVHEGQMVADGDLLARIVDTEARLAEGRAEIELKVAAMQAENDVNLRFARKSVEVAKAELARSLDSVENYPKSVSDTELDRLRLVVQRATLEVEQAELERDVAGRTRQIKENACQTAREKVQRHRIVSPLDGMVVQVGRHRGEWVEPGAAVVRVVRLDRLRAEGFIPAGRLTPALQDARVTLALDLPGKPGAELPGRLVFVSPEIDAVNAEVRVWAEIENTQLLLRPGMRGTMTIALPEEK